MWFNGKLYISLDTEFCKTDFSSTGTLSYALAREGETFYAVNGDMDEYMPSLELPDRMWMRDNVWPHLPGGSPEDFDRDHGDVMTFDRIARKTEAFFERAVAEAMDDIDRIVLIAHCGAQDLVRLRMLWNEDWSILPRCIPNWGDDVKRLRLAAHMASEALPEQPERDRHHALKDAVHDLGVIRMLLEADPANQEVF
jgi:hypothetical protein